MGGYIRKDLREIGWEDVDWMHLAQHRHQWRVLVNTVMNLWVPLITETFLTRLVTTSFSRWTLLHGVS